MIASTVSNAAISAGFTSNTQMVYNTLAVLGFLFSAGNWIYVCWKKRINFSFEVIDSTFIARSESVDHYFPVFVSIRNHSLSPLYISSISFCQSEEEYEYLRVSTILHTEKHLESATFPIYLDPLSCINAYLELKMPYDFRVAFGSEAKFKFTVASSESPIFKTTKVPYIGLYF